MANDLLSALRTYLAKVGSGEKSPQEVAAALNQWARESGDALKKRVEEEVEAKVKRMGFAKQSDLERLEREIAELKGRKAAGASVKKNPAKKAPNKSGKKPTKKSAQKAAKR